MVNNETSEIKLSARRIKAILNDAEKAAASVDLVYTSDSNTGISRVAKGKSFSFRYSEKTIKDTTTIQRINTLAIPPAWQNVWICPMANGHLQATGFDSLQRKQYKYHVLWNAIRNHTKFFRLQHFGEALPAIRKNLNKDLALSGLPKRKVLAAVVSLMERTNIRVGNNAYEKLYGSFGITTLKDKHVKINGSQMQFSFKGKKGIFHNVTLKNKKLANIVKNCREIPGKELFQYFNEKGERDSIDSGMINNYIREISGGEFTAKDFRTWTGSVLALMAFKDVPPCQSKNDIKKNINNVLQSVSERLGNTQAVCRKYYVHPCLLSLYEKDKLNRYLKPLGSNNKVNAEDALLYEEQVFLKILSTRK